MRGRDIGDLLERRQDGVERPVAFSRPHVTDDVVAHPYRSHQAGPRVRKVDPERFPGQAQSLQQPGGSKLCDQTGRGLPREDRLAPEAIGLIVNLRVGQQPEVRVVDLDRAAQRAGSGFGDDDEPTAGRRGRRRNRAAAEGDLESEVHLVPRVAQRDRQQGEVVLSGL